MWKSRNHFDKYRGLVFRGVSLGLGVFTQDLGVLASIGFTIYHPYPLHTKPQQNRMTIPIIPLPTFRERDPSLGVWRGLPVTHKTSTKQEDS